MKITAFTLLFICLVSCRSLPAPPEYDPACFEARLPVGVAYTHPDDMDRLFPVPVLRLFPQSTTEPVRLVTIRRIGPYSEPEAQLTLTQLANGRVRAEFAEPVDCSVSDQLFRLFVEDISSTEDERIATVRIRRFTITENDLPELRTIYRRFQRLRLSVNLPAGLVLDTRAYTLWIETPMQMLHLETTESNKALAIWAESAIAAVRAHDEKPAPVP